MARELNLSLPLADDLFSTQEERDTANLERVEILSADLIDDFPDHPFMVRMDAKMVETMESIGLYGVLVPCIVRPKANGRYEMIAGHRRKHGSLENGILTLPCIVRDLTDDEATIIMVDSNLQRETILPSEKAFAYKMKLEAMNRQGQRTDLTSRPVGDKSKSVDIIGEQTGESGRQVHRYIRLTHLIPTLLQMVDNAELGEKPQIAMRPAVELSYLPQAAQEWIVQAIAMEDATPSHVQALKMRQFEKDGQLNEGVILSIMQEEKPNQVEKIKIPHDKISRFFPEDTPAEKITAAIVEALELRQRKLERDRQRKAQEHGAR